MQVRRIVKLWQSMAETWRPAVASFLVASFLAISLQIALFIFSPISPHPFLELPNSSSAGDEGLQRLSKLGDGVVKDPEDVCVETSAGIVYTASRDGWVKRLHLRNGSWENWNNIQSDSLLGIAVSKDAGILVCDARKGLLKVDEDGFSVLVPSRLNQTTIISFADDVVEAADGSIYLSDASSKFGLHNWYLDFLEAKPHGRLLKYQPSSNQISTLLDNLYFANGVALSKDQRYVVVCESFRYRCLKYWLQGHKQGQTEIFIHNLPGSPDNINLAPDGSFWIALLQPVREGSEWFVRWKIVRHILAIFPKLQAVVEGARRRSMVVKVSEEGRIVRKLEDPNGKVISFVTSAVEFENHLYLGSLNANFIGKLSLTDP